MKNTPRTLGDNTLSQETFTMGSNRVEIDVLGVHKKHVKHVVHSSKRKRMKKVIFLHTSCPNSNRPVFGLKEF
jgi:hypothetical protein